MNRTKQEQARRARAHMLDAISRCVQEENVMGLPLTHIFSGPPSTRTIPTFLYLTRDTNAPQLRHRT